MAEYVTETGLNRKTLQEIRLDLEAAFRHVFGQSFETSVDSPNGLLISQLSLAISNLWELAQEVYVSRDPAQAEGTALDWIAALSGITRKPATACQVEAVLYTEDASVTVPAGSRALRSRGSLEFTLDSEVSVSRTGCYRLLIQDDGSTFTDSYTFHFTFGDVTLPSTEDTSISNISRLYTLVTAAGGSAQVVDGNLVVWDPDASTVGITGTLPDDFIIYAGGLGDFTAVSTGTQTCEVGELDSIVSSVSGWDMVYNYETGTPGSDTESDAALRVRQSIAVKSVSTRGTDQAIATHIIQDVEGVTSARVVSNRTPTEDADGRPPKSFEALVVGGEDADVAQAIYENQPAGIQSWGNIAVNVTDSNGDLQVIRFSRPVAKYLWIKVTYTPYTEESAPTDDEIKAALLEWAAEEYTQGKDVITQRVMQGLYSVSGIGNATAQCAITDNPGDMPVYGSTTGVIAITSSEYAVLAEGRISIVEEA